MILIRCAVITAVADDENDLVQLGNDPVRLPLPFPLPHNPLLTPSKKNTADIRFVVGLDCGVVITTSQSKAVGTKSIRPNSSFTAAMVARIRSPTANR